MMLGYFRKVRKYIWKTSLKICDLTEKQPRNAFGAKNEQNQKSRWIKNNNRVENPKKQAQNEKLYKNTSKLRFAAKVP